MKFPNLFDELSVEEQKASLINDLAIRSLKKGNLFEIITTYRAARYFFNRMPETG